MATTSGVGSNIIDVNSIVSQLMTVEQRPLTLLKSKESKLNAQVSAYGSLSSALSSFQSAMTALGDLEKFKVFSASSSDATVLTASASSAAAAGNHSVEVVRVAENHKLFSSASFAETDTLAANTTLTLTVGSTPFSVDISGKTLSQAATAINEASDNAGVTATVANVDGGYKLLLTAKETGSSSAIGVTYSGADPFSFTTINQDRDAIPGFTSADLDAVMILDGSASLTATRSSNTVTDLIGGVTLTLKKAGTVTLSTDRDTAAIAKSAQAFADAFNTLRSKISELRIGSLAGDSSLLSLESRVMGVLNTAPTGLAGSYSYLSQVGVSIQKDGTMSLDNSVLTTALNSDFSAVANLFANNDQGYAYRMQVVAKDLLATDGLVDSRTDGLKASISSVKNQEEQTSNRLRLIEARYRAQFSALDTMLGSMSTTSNFLTAQLANLPGYA
jgi:flagellar hook-associated protein 2